MDSIETSSKNSNNSKNKNRNKNNNNINNISKVNSFASSFDSSSSVPNIIKKNTNDLLSISSISSTNSLLSYSTFALRSNMKFIVGLRDNAIISRTQARALLASFRRVNLHKIKLNDIALNYLTNKTIKNLKLFFKKYINKSIVCDLEGCNHLKLNMNNDKSDNFTNSTNNTPLSRSKGTRTFSKSKSSWINIPTSRTPSTYHTHTFTPNYSDVLTPSFDGINNSNKNNNNITPFPISLSEADINENTTNKYSKIKNRLEIDNDEILTVNTV